MGLRRKLLKTTLISTGIVTTLFVGSMIYIGGYLVPKSKGVDLEKPLSYQRDVLQPRRGYFQIAEEIRSTCWKELRSVNTIELGIHIWKINGKKPKAIAGDEIKVPVYCGIQN